MHCVSHRYTHLPELDALQEAWADQMLMLIQFLGLRHCMQPTCSASTFARSHRARRAKGDNVASKSLATGLGKRYRLPGSSVL